MKLNSLDDLLSAIISDVAPKQEVSKPLFFAHADLNSGQVIAISPVKTTNPDLVDIEISHTQAEAFLTGKDGFLNWIAKTDAEGKPLLFQKEKEKLGPRKEMLPIQEVRPITTSRVDVRIIVCEDHVEIHYNGDKIQALAKESNVRLYFTKEDDPTYLKCAFTLSVNTLDAILKENHLPKWPNPIILPLEDTDDLSIYMRKSSILAGRVRKHEASDNRV